jgi:NodT family efflux transporter outer membrane factor (OMF) lipoprotein
VAGLGGCSLAPTYHKPTIAIPAAFKENSGIWQAAQPSDQLPRGDWWSIYGSDTLNGLEAQLNQANPTLATMLGRYDSARAFESQLSSGLFPQVGVQASPGHDRQSANRVFRGRNQPNESDNNELSFSAGYELDLWGRVRNEVAAGRAQAQAADADMASVTLSLQAQLADVYIQLQGYDIQARILDDSIKAYQQALNLTQARFAGEIASQLDVARAKAQLDDAQAQASEVSAQRALAEHAIASLIGQPASSFSLPVAPVSLQVPAIPLSVPSTLLQRRPDIAAAERRTFAANAEIGVARAAFFPSLSINAVAGWQNTNNGSLLTAANRFWALGPLAALPLFDGGLRKAQERQAKANLDIAASEYRSLVLSAFQHVEDNLSLLNHLGREAQQENDAAAAAQQAQDIATHRYSEGIVNYLEVVTAQTATLTAERTTEQVRTRQLQASVDLIRALGGGWDGALTSTSPASPVKDSSVAQAD